MLSRDDYINHLEQISQLEREMANLYKDCVDRVEDKYVKEVCNGLFNAEKRHDLIVKELKNIIIS